MNLLTLYEGRFGRAVRRQGDGFNGPCPLCGGEPGKSDRFVVWPHKRENLGEACRKHGLDGVWWCRQCGKSGDSIAYLMEVEGMGFKDALREFGITPEGSKGSRARHGIAHAYRRPAAARHADHSPTFEPRALETPGDKWREYAAKLLAEAQGHIHSQTQAAAQAMAWLAQRGISPSAVTAYGIGYLPPEGKCTFGRFRSREALGLEAKTKPDGTPKKLFIPRGIVIPSVDLQGNVTNLRIRRHAEDLQAMPNGRTPPKYMELEGSSRAPLLLMPSRPVHLSAFFVVEAELDAMLIHHTSGGHVGALAVRTNRGKPDVHAHALLQQCARILIALDYDDAGAEGVDWWQEQYTHAKRWPTPDGKDPGDAFQLGEDMHEWIAAAMPPSIALPPKEQQAHAQGQKSTHEQSIQEPTRGQLDASLVCVSSGGAGASPNTEMEEIERKGDIQTHTRGTSPAAAIQGVAQDVAQGTAQGANDATTSTSIADKYRRKWEGGTASAPLPADAPDIVSLRRSLAGKSVHDELLVVCPRYKWWYIYLKTCKKCGGHPKCIVDFQLSPQMLAPYTQAEHG